MLQLFGASFVTFFVVIDPPALAPMFATMTGILLAALAAQFVLDGIKGAFGLGA